MAWYEIEYGCGHTIRKQLYGKNSERERYVKWAKTNKCPECQMKKTSEDAAEWAKSKGLPKLTGTDKQIAWAEVIRKSALIGMASFVKRNIKILIDKYPKELIKEALDKYRNETSAKFWIENRDLTYDIDLWAEIEEIKKNKSESTKKPITKKPAKKTTKKTHTLSKYGQMKQTGEVKNLGADQKRDAKPAGYRKSKSGNVYYEGRMNRSDCSPHESKKYKKR